MSAQAALARGTRRLREDRGWTQAELAEKTKRSVQFIASIEQGSKAASLDSIDRVCSAFRVTASELFAIGEERISTKPSQREVIRALSELSPERELEVAELVLLVTRMLTRERTKKVPGRVAPKPLPRLRGRPK